jgi:hypothetical protein
VQTMKYLPCKSNVSSFGPHLVGKFKKWYLFRDMVTLNPIVQSPELAVESVLIQREVLGEGGIPKANSKFHG